MCGMTWRRLIQKICLTAMVLSLSAAAGEANMPETGAETGAAGEVAAEETEVAEDGEGSPESGETAAWVIEPPFEMETVHQFRVPVPQSWTTQRNRGMKIMRSMDEGASHVFQARAVELNGVFFAPETRDGLYQELLSQLDAERYRPVTIGENELAFLFPDLVELEDGTEQEDHRLRLMYGYGNYLLLLDFVSWDDPLDPRAMDAILPEIRWIPAEGEATLADYQLTVFPPDGKNTISGGEKKRYQATFANPDTVNYWKNNDGIEWHVIAQDEQFTDYFSISENGTLSVAKELTEPVNVAVIALSTKSGTQNYLEVQALPPVQSLRLAQDQFDLYLGLEETAELEVQVEPDTATRDLDWVSMNLKTAAVETAESGKAVIRGVSPGKTKITVLDRNTGIRAQAQVRVLRPVTEVSVLGASELQPGKVAFYHALMLPANASDRRAKWSVDVAPDIAEIRSDGRLEIRENAAPGTVITVRCEAPGSGPAAIAAEYTVTVTE